MRTPQPHLERPQIIVGQIKSPHGVKGLVRVKSYTEPTDNLMAYSSLYDEAGTRLDLTFLHADKDSYLCKVEGLNTRNEVEGLKGVQLMIYRDQLPPSEDEDEFYHHDLVGLNVVAMGNDEIIGTLIGVQNFGAGDLLELSLAKHSDKASIYLPFTRDNVPKIDLEKGKIMVEHQAILDAITLEGSA